MTQAVQKGQEIASLPHLLERIEPYQAQVLQHPIYEQLDTVAGIRRFMESHVFAVWDNMLLLKTLQQRLTCVVSPWCPPEDAIAARLINEIILDEESEEVRPGQYMSHLEFYIAAMEEIGAETQAIRLLIRQLQKGDTLETAIALSSKCLGHSISPVVQSFVLQTWKCCQGETPGIIASFLLAREAIVSPLFSIMLHQIKCLEQVDAIPCVLLQGYCDRHLSVDEERHIPMGLELLDRVCGNDKQAWKQAEMSAISSLGARKQLWDALSDMLSTQRR